MTSKIENKLDDWSKFGNANKKSNQEILEDRRSINNFKKVNNFSGISNISNISNIELNLDSRKVKPSKTTSLNSKRNNIERNKPVKATRLDTSIYSHRDNNSRVSQKSKSIKFSEPSSTRNTTACTYDRTTTPNCTDSPHINIKKESKRNKNVFRSQDELNKFEFKYNKPNVKSAFKNRNN